MPDLHHDLQERIAATVQRDDVSEAIAESSVLLRALHGSTETEARHG